MTREYKFETVLDKVKETELKNKELFDNLKEKLDTDIKEMKLNNLKVKEKKFSDIDIDMNKQFKDVEKKILEITQNKKEEINNDVVELKKKYLNNKNKVVEYLMENL